MYLRKPEMACTKCREKQNLIDELLKKQKESKENEDTLQEYFRHLEDEKNELFSALFDVQTKLDTSESTVSEVKLSLSESIIENDSKDKKIAELKKTIQKCKEELTNQKKELEKTKENLSYLEGQYVDLTTKNIEDEKKHHELEIVKEQSDIDYSLKISILSKEKIELYEKNKDLTKSLISLMLKNRVKTKIQKDKYYTDLKRIKYAKKSNESSNKILIEKFRKEYFDLENENTNLKNTLNHYNNIIPALNHQIQCLSRTPYQVYY